MASWSTRELERQIGALLFEFERRAANWDQQGVLALARRGQAVAVSADVINDPFVLELREPPAALEREFEQALIDRLDDFLVEMGKDPASSRGRSGSPSTTIISTGSCGSA